MFKFVENAYLSVLEKEREEKMELEKARKLNEDLKNRFKKLEEENKDLKEKFTENEIGIITRKNDLNNLLVELQKERRANLESSQRLQICKEQIESINNFIEELKPIKEQLNFKRSVTECIHDLLVKTKLRIAESDDVLQNLHDYLTQLEYEVEKSKSFHNKGVGQWQDEFLAARLGEAEVILEFDKLKREVAIIKNELEEKKLIRDARESVYNKSEENPGKSSWSSKKDIKIDKISEQIFEEEERIIANTVELQNEIDHLRNQLKKLEYQKEDCDRRIRSNEEIKVNLNEVRRSIWLREFETNQKINNLKEKYKKLADKMSKELGKIQNNMEEKDMSIARIEEKIKELLKMNDSLEQDFKSSHTQDNPITDLEKTKLDLEDEILRLKKT